MNIVSKEKNRKTACYHCGDDCNEQTMTDGRHFCCDGCRQVYLLLQETNLCNYYSIENNPGIKARGKFVSERFAYLDDESVLKQLSQFASEEQVNISFSIPHMHCASCIYLLENLHRMEEGIIKSQTDFQRKEIFIVFKPRQISLRKVVELLAFIGYEPNISLNDHSTEKNKPVNRKHIYKIGVAGFCFSNIMMLSFPEYFSGGYIEQAGLKATFSWLILALSLPVLFFSAAGFFASAWKSIRQKIINIDAPIVLAVLVTYGRSYYEIISGLGVGYLDSGTGIVFFMLIGRWFQDKTYHSLAFDRDYKSYFPLGVTILQHNEEKNIPVNKLKKGDRIIIKNEEMIPADAILISGDASIDYSFVSGENLPVNKKKGEMIYAGGKQIGTALILECVSEVSQSYFTRLWNNDIFRSEKTENSFIHPWSRYFTIVLFSVAFITAIYWWINDPKILLPALTSVLIVACPCSLLLSATFTYGNMLRIFGKNKLYLKNAGIIEKLAAINTIVFDKTGTLTKSNSNDINYEGQELSTSELTAIKVMARQSAHPASKLVYERLGQTQDRDYSPTFYREYSGAGAEACINDINLKIGSSAFINKFKEAPICEDTGSHVYVMIDQMIKGRFVINNRYRPGIDSMVAEVRKNHFELHVLSGDNVAEQKNLEDIFGSDASISFNQSPQSKLDYIQKLQCNSKNVLMLGDGLNDAGALMQSNVGIAVSDQSARFTPACDAIIDGDKVHLVSRFLAYASSGKKIITISFIVSILYNITGLAFAVQGLLSPMIAAIIMPVSSISIVLLVTLLSSASAYKHQL